MKKLFLTIVAFSLLFSCTMVYAEEEIELSYWGWGPHVTGINEEISPAFQKIHPHVKVKGISMGPWDLMEQFDAHI